MMEYDELLERFGEFGKFHWILSLFLGIITALNAETTYMFNFLLGNHLHRCLRPDIEDDEFHILNVTSTYNSTQCSLISNGTKLACTEWVYDQSVYTSTLISKFDMVCKDKFTRSHVMSAFFFGQLFGSAICGFISDIFGRRPYLIGSGFILFAANIVLPWVPNVLLVIVCQVFNAAATIALYNISIIIVTEFVNPSYRILANFLINFPFCMGEFILLLEAYFLRDFKYLMIAIASPCLLCLLMLIFIPESPRWLIVKGRTNEAKQVLQKIAAYNSIDLDIKEEELRIKEMKIYSFVQTFKITFKSSKIVIILLILMSNWFTINMIYFGIALNIGDLRGNVYINFAISATTEAIALFLCIWSNKVSRKRLLISSTMVSSVCCLSTFFTSYFGEDRFEWATISLAMLGKFGITIAFFVLYVVTAEVLPTTMRATILSVCSVSGKIGGLVSPYIGKLGVLLDTRFGVALPLIIFGIIGTITAIFNVFLPETRDTKLPDIIEDVTESDRRLCSSNTTSDRQ